MGKKNVKIQCYADNAVVIAENEDELHRLLFKFSTAPEVARCTNENISSKNEMHNYLKNSCQMQTCCK